MKQELKQNRFIEKAKIVHNNKYNYSLVDYQGPHIKVKILCITHGEFEQTPDSHVRNHGCSKCNGGVKFNTLEFIKISNEIHNNKYEYSNVNYINNNTKVKIICPIHGEFEQTPSNHMNHYGCYECGINKRTKSRTKDTNYFINLANIVHNNFYDYSLVDYNNTKTKVKIICPDHGEFEQKPNDHVSNKNGCPLCCESKGEREIRNYLINQKIKFIQEKRFHDCKHKRQLPFDFYLPDLNICIEYDGEHHFKNISTYHKNISLIDIEIKDKIKTDYCDGIDGRPTLIRISYLEFKTIKQKLNGIINNL